LSKNQYSSPWLFICFIFLCASLSFYGWVSNIILLFYSDFSEISGEEVLRVVGVFIAPIGCVMGYL
jgi:hypothetical protein